MFYQVMCDADTLIKLQTTISTLWTYSIIRFYVGKIWSVMKSHDLSFSTYSGKLRAVVWNKEIRLSLLVVDLRKQSSLNSLLKMKLVRYLTEKWQNLGSIQNKTIIIMTSQAKYKKDENLWFQSQLWKPMKTNYRSLKMNSREMNSGSGGTHL